MTAAAAFAAWIGGSIVVLAEGRRGLATGVFVIAVAFAALAVGSGQPYGAIALLAGGAAAAGLRLRSGSEGWDLMRPGSTPRLILTIVVGLLSLYIAASVSTGDGGPLRFAVLAAAILCTARLLSGADRSVAMTAAAGVALALGAGTLADSGAPVLATCVAAAVVAAGVSALPRTEPSGA